MTLKVGMTFEEYEERCDHVYDNNPDWRWGQTLFNVLAEVRPDLAEEIRGAALDPFFWRNGEPAVENGFVLFHEFVRNRW